MKLVPRSNTQSAVDFAKNLEQLLISCLPKINTNKKTEIYPKKKGNYASYPPTPTRTLRPYRLKLSATRANKTILFFMTKYSAFEKITSPGKSFHLGGMKSSTHSTHIVAHKIGVKNSDWE